MKIYFFLGKGGVGKSTLSSLTSIYLAAQGNNTLLVSLDPAHNLSDIFGKTFSDKPSKIRPNLSVSEMNHDKWIKAFLKQSEQQLKKSYTYLSSFSMEKHFAVMQHAPALEEYALQQAFAAIIEKKKTYDFIIFDMPPTALSLKFFALPKLSLIWLDSLVKLRSQIIEKQQIISRLSLGKKTFERDRVMQNIQNQQNHWQHLDEILRNKDVSIPLIVENPDQLSVAETGRIMQKMKDLNMPAALRALNNAENDTIKGYDLVVQKTELSGGLPVLEEAAAKIDFSKLLG